MKDTTNSSLIKTLKKLLNLFFSIKTTLVLFLILFIALATSTWIEDKYDILTAKLLIYNATWFEVLIVLLALNFIGNIKKYNLFSKKRIGGLLFHSAFIVLIIGGGITRYFGHEGSMHINQGETSNAFYVSAPHLYIKASDNKDNYAVDRPLSLSSITDNSFQVRIDSEKGPIDIVYNNYIKHAVKTISENGTVKYVPAKEENHGVRVLILDISFNGKKQQISVLGGPGYSHDYHKIKMDNVALQIAFGNKKVVMPFSIHLNKFMLDKYPGSKIPSSVASDITITDSRNGFTKKHRIFINNVLDYDGYTIFQKSYDKDEKATILSVNYDFYGTWVTYFGYFMMMLGFTLTLFNKNSRYWDLLRKIGLIQTRRKSARKSQTSSLTNPTPNESKLWRTFFSQTSSDSISHQRGLSKGIWKIIGILGIVFLLGAIGFLTLGNNQQKSASIQHTEKFGQLITQTYNGRFAPVNTLAYDVMHKIAKKDNFNIPGKGKMNAMDIFVDIPINAAFWKQQKIIYIREKSVIGILGIEGNYAAFNDFFFKDYTYKLFEITDNAFRKNPEKRNTLDKEVLKVAERLEIFKMTYQGKMLCLFPEQGSLNNKWLTWADQLAYTPLTGPITIINQDLQLKNLNYNSIMTLYYKEVSDASKSGNYAKADKIVGYISSIQRHSAAAKLLPSETLVNAEISYNEANIFITLKNTLGVLSIVLLLFSFIDNLKSKKSKFVSVTLNFFIVLLGLAFAYHTFGMFLRWYVSGHTPWSDGYEVLLLATWSVLLAGFCFLRYSKIALAGTALLAFLILMTAAHSSYDPQLTNLIPMLKSYWLVIHVATLTIGYGFLGLGFILGLICLVLYLCITDKNAERLGEIIDELTSINELTLTVGLFLVTIGTFFGAVWANESWGRYWGWDAKETWSLAIIIAYSMLLHFRLVPFMKGKYMFNVGAVISFASVLMTFIGINYYFTKSIHSYASGSTPVFPLWGWVVTFMILGLIVLAGIKSKKLSERL
ncbi:MAG: cytochrome c biogenesis protein CcsA [Flavobacteriaceae bacterium]|nr:cytochrome c biogenesis protein CcsA [Flavobacteriaceae bacterium]